MEPAVAAEPEVKLPAPNPAAPFEGDDEPAAKPEAAKPDKKTPDELAEARRENAELQKRLAEVSASERFWAGKAQGNLPDGADDDQPDDTEEPPLIAKTEEPDPLPDEFLEEFSKQGVPAIRKVITKEFAKAGFVRKQDVEKLAAEIAERKIGTATSRLTADAKLVTDYPGLKDENSPLFKATLPIYQNLIKLDPGLKNSPATLFLAADQAKLQLQIQELKNGKGGDYREDDRRRRIEGQMEPTGRGRATPYEGDEDDQLSQGQRELIALMGVDENDYREKRSAMRRKR